MDIHQQLREQDQKTSDAWRRADPEYQAGLRAVALSYEDRASAVFSMARRIRERRERADRLGLSRGAIDAGPAGAALHVAGQPRAAVAGNASNVETETHLETAYSEPRAELVEEMETPPAPLSIPNVEQEWRAKRSAVYALLDNPELAKLSNREIARRCSVTHTFVNRIRQSSRAAVAQVEAMKRRPGNAG